MSKTILLSIGLLFCVNAAFAQENETPPSEVQTFDCGTNCLATLYDNGLFKITPTAETGKIRDYQNELKENGNGNQTKAPWIDYSSQISKIEIADGITYIGNSAFQGLDSVVSVSISDTVTSISYLAFADSKSLTTVDMSNALVNLGAYAFSLSPITHIDLPDTLTTIGGHALWGTKVQDTNIPDSVNYIGYGAFASISQNAKIYCNNTNGRCNEMIPDDYTGASHLALYTKEGGRYILDGQRYKTLEDMQKRQNALKRIYTVEEAEKASKPTGNTFTLRYK